MGALLHLWNGNGDSLDLDEYKAMYGSKNCGQFVRRITWQWCPAEGRSAFVLLQ